MAVAVLAPELLCGSQRTAGPSGWLVCSPGQTLPEAPNALAFVLSATLGSGCGRRATRRGRRWRKQGLTAYWRAGPVSLRTAFVVGLSPDQVETAAVTDGARDASIESLAAV